MAISELPLGYCGNVHPGLTVAEVVDGWDRCLVPVQHELGHAVAAGLWLPAAVVDELLATSSGVERFASELQRRELVCYTLNAFPYGNFHSERVKEQVYLPDWTDPLRGQYTLNCAQILARLLPEGVDGSISTVPLGFKALSGRDGFVSECVQHLLKLALDLAELQQRTGKTIRLAIEPEPFCILETTEETVAFFGQLWHSAESQGCLEACSRHLGICYDVCHQAVEFEDQQESIGELSRAGVPINKVHLTCALEARNPGRNEEVREALLQFVEPRYLHQTFARSSEGLIARMVDLTREMIQEPLPDFANAREWRIHYHVPVNAETVGPLGTTRDDLRQAIRAIAALPEAPHLEVETYTWSVLPDGQSRSLVEGLVQELAATQQLLGAPGSGSSPTPASAC